MNLVKRFRNKISDAIATISTWSMARDANGEPILPAFNSFHARFLRKLAKLSMWVTPAEDLEADLQRSIEIARAKRSALYQEDISGAPCIDIVGES
jgi:hypothetical protein